MFDGLLFMIRFLFWFVALVIATMVWGVNGLVIIVCAVIAFKTLNVL